ncbi:MAG TPA: ABC transporter ATP-binding protein [Solirubrobacteraceae bacterium]|nr:ABC transporter ATP-binding protein [Solirubrobacteraceae bacterium]
MQRTVSTALADAPTAPATAPAVVVDHLSKHFRLPHRRYNTLKERVLHPWQTRSFETLHAVDDVTFEIAAGEFFGIVGRNGSGKSTLLKCLAGIYDVTAGDATTRGRVSPFIELGVGFSPELTARDNVIINAIMLGLTRRQAYERFDEIIAFAELENFLDLKLKNYSSGMAVRLAFSVAVQVDADILLVDEVLAVGDAAFQQKCFDQFHALKKAGKTIIFVTHDMSAVQRFCDRALLLEHGRLMQIGDPYDIASAYNELNFGQLPSGGGLTVRGDRVAELRGGWFEDERGERVTMVERGQPVVMCVQVLFNDAVSQPRVHFHLRNQAHHTVFATSTELLPIETGDYAAGETAVFRLKTQNWFSPGRYDLSPTLAAADAGPGDAIDVRENIAAFVVPGALHFDGVVELPHTIDVERRP